MILNYLKKNIIKKNINIFLNSRSLCSINKTSNFFLHDRFTMLNNWRIKDQDRYLDENKLVVLNDNNKIINKQIDTTMPLNTGKARLVILGSGWAGGRLAKDIDCVNKYDLTVISSKNHMVFTPLLPSSCVGTVHNQSVIENIRHIQPGILSQEYNKARNITS